VTKRRRRCLKNAHVPASQKQPPRHHAELVQLATRYLLEKSQTHQVVEKSRVATFRGPREFTDRNPLRRLHENSSTATSFTVYARHYLRFSLRVPCALSAFVLVCIDQCAAL
jgi:hypothetical protein